jgi:hypothetical protein
MNGDSGAPVVPPPMPGALIGHRADDGRQVLVRVEPWSHRGSDLRFAEGPNADNGQTPPSAARQRASVSGFSSDGSAVFLQVSRPEGPDAIEHFVPASGERREVYRHGRLDPEGPILSLDRTAVLGVYVRDPQRRMHRFEPEHPEAKLQLSLAAALKGHDVRGHLRDPERTTGDRPRLQRS